MPKLKTRKSVAKRFKITGTGKVLRAKAWGNKKRLAKSARTKRMYDKFYEVPSAIGKLVRAATPYGV